MINSFRVAAAALAVAASLGVYATAQSKSWSLPGPDSSNYRAYEQITKANVSQLAMAWSYPYGGAINSPVFAHDTLYGLGRNGTAILALDAATGKEIWIHEGLTGVTAKGFNYWESEDGSDRRLIFCSESFLQEIDAKTGKTIPTFGIDGAVDMRKGLLRAEGTSISAQPASPGRIWKHTIIFGGQSGEAIMTPAGDIRAYDVVTGKLVWQFNTVPQPGQYGYETNPPDGWNYIGGANNWGEMALDDERGIVTSRPGRRPPISGAAIATDRICSPTACWRSTRGRASACGTSRRCTTICGTSTTSPRRSWSASCTTAGRWTSSRTPGRRDFSTCSTG
jgi:glucose dehydrogenase